MSLKALSEEYRQSAKLLKSRIDALKAERKNARGIRAVLLSNRIAELDRMYNATMREANELLHYYDGSPSVKEGDR